MTKMLKKLSSRDIEARMQKIKDSVLKLNERLADQGDQATLSFCAVKFMIVKHDPENVDADVTIWLGHGLE